MANDIFPLEESNLGGNWKLARVDHDGVDWSQFPEEVNKNYEDAVVLLDGYSWSEYKFTIDTLLFKETKVENGGFITEITAVVGKDRPKLLSIFEKEERKRHLVVLYNNNRDQILVGREDEHVKIDIPERNSGLVTLNRNQYIIVFTCLSMERQPFYQFSGQVYPDYFPDDYDDLDYNTDF